GRAGRRSCPRRSGPARRRRRAPGAGRGRSYLLSLRREREVGVRRVDVGLHGLDGDLAPASGLGLRAVLEGEREVDPGDLLVGAQVRDAFAHGAADVADGLDADLEQGVRVEVVEELVAVLEGE